MTSCGSITIDGCIYNIKLTYNNTDGTAATLNPVDDQKDAVKEKVKQVVDALKQELAKTPSAKPLSSYKTLQLNNAGVKLDDLPIEWTRLESVHAVWNKVYNGGDDNQGLAALCIQMSSVKGTHQTTASKGSRNDSVTATIKTGLGGSPEPETASEPSSPTASGPPVVPDDINHIATEFKFESSTELDADTINTIYEYANKYKDSQLTSQQKIRVFLKIVDRLTEELKADQATVRHLVLHKLLELKTTIGDQNIVGAIQGIKGVLTHLYPNDLDLPTAETIANPT
jgi:hypothetical protein